MTTLTIEAPCVICKKQTNNFHKIIGQGKYPENKDAVTYVPVHEDCHDKIASKD